MGGGASGGAGVGRAGEAEVHFVHAVRHGARPGQQAGVFAQRVDKRVGAALVEVQARQRHAVDAREDHLRPGGA